MTASILPQLSRHAPFILPRDAGEGDRATRGGGGARRKLLALYVGETHHAPSTMLRMVPLPRFAGEDKGSALPGERSGFVLPALGASRAMVME